MSFFKDLSDADTFKDKAELSLKKNLLMLDTFITTGFTPYRSIENLCEALIFPHFIAAQVIRDMVRFTYGAAVLTGAILSLNLGNACEVAFGMTLLAGSVGLGVLNTVCAAINFATRSTVSMIGVWAEIVGIQHDTLTDDAERLVYKTISHMI